MLTDAPALLRRKPAALQARLEALAAALGPAAGLGADAARMRAARAAAAAAPRLLLEGRAGRLALRAALLRAFALECSSDGGNERGGVGAEGWVLAVAQQQPRALAAPSSALARLFFAAAQPRLAPGEEAGSDADAGARAAFVRGRPPGPAAAAALVDCNTDTFLQRLAGPGASGPGVVALRAAYRAFLTAAVDAVETAMCSPAAEASAVATGGEEAEGEDQVAGTEADGEGDGDGDGNVDCESGAEGASDADKGDAEGEDACGQLERRLCGLLNALTDDDPRPSPDTPRADVADESSAIANAAGAANGVAALMVSALQAEAEATVEEE
jgi:hypothetical protein